MQRAETVRSPRALASGIKSARAKHRDKAAQTKVSLALDPAEAVKTIDRIREEVESRHKRALELKAKRERLTGTAFSELLKVKELTSIIVSLKEKGGEKSAPELPATNAEGASPVSADHPREQWKRELDLELEKLTITEKLLETSLTAAVEKKEPAAVAVEPNGVKKILVVDDDLTTVKIISHFLQKENYRVHTALSGVDGLKKAFKEGPDLILLDVMMPDLNGFQFLSIYRQDIENARTPVVILSSLSEEADLLKGLEIGAVDYVTKPFSPQVLIAKIKKNINSRA